MTGARNRAAGHDAELEMVHYLRAHGWPDARTTRAALGHDGTATPGDIDFAPGVVLDVKRRTALDIPGWLRQVEADAGPGSGRLPLVVCRRARQTDVGDWWAVCRFAHLLPLLGADT